MKQNIYDDPTFFAGYMAMRRKKGGSNQAIEIPAMRALIGDVAGARVLDLGCGGGRLTAELARRGARSVVGVDLSRRMLDVARTAAGGLPGVTLRRAAIEDFSAPDASFDLIVSSLALHYVKDYRGLLARAARWLSPGGRLIFSVEHPITTANPRSWVFGEDGSFRHWALDNYLREGRRTKTWIVDGVTVYHRTVETLVEGVFAAGLELVTLREPSAAPGLIPKDMEACSTPERLDLRVPSFLFIGARRRRQP
jgi:SAM-dependent methyltransferase